MVSSILLFASEISSACGFNPYKKRSETLVAVWNRINPGASQTKEERIDNLIEQIDIGKDVVALIEESSTANSIQDIKPSVEKIRSLVPQNLPESVRSEVIRRVESQINCQFGTNQEASAINSYESEQTVVVSKRNDAFYKRSVGNVDGTPIYVGGKVDGIKEDGTVIEVKNRMRRFFDPLPKYDVVQLQTYLFIIDSQNGELVEQLKGDRTQIKSTSVKRDDDMWTSLIIPRIVTFCKALITVLNDHELQSRIANGDDDDRERIINELM